MERRRIVLAAGFAALAAAAADGCSRRQPAEKNAPATAAAPVRGGRFVLGLQQEPEMLTSVLQVTKSGRAIDNALFSRFVTYDDSLHLVPDLLIAIPTPENGGISADGRVYTYHLRPGVRWHDGRPLTALDVVFTFQVIMNPECGAETQQGFDVVDRVETPDSLTVVFHLREPYASFVADTFSDEDVLPRHLLAGDVGPRFRDAAFHRSPVGSGPFRFVEWVPGSHLTVRRYDEYHGGQPWLDEIVFQFVPDATALAVRLQAGDLNGFDQAEASQLPLLEKLPGIRLFRTAALNYEHLDFNCEHPILADARVRRALAHATDREAIATHVYEGLAVAARADMPPLLPWYNPAADTANAHDPERAKRLLEAAGWRDSNGDGIRERGTLPLRLEITTTAGRPARERTEVVLQQQWRAVGVDLVIRNLNASVLFGEDGPLRTGKFQVALFGWGQSPDPSGMEVVYGSRFVPPAGQNMGRFRDARLDSLAALGTRVAATAARAPIYRDIEAILLGEMPVIPLVWQVEVDPMTERLQNYRPSPTAVAGDTWNVHAWWLSPGPS